MQTYTSRDSYMILSRNRQNKSNNEDLKTIESKKKLILIAKKRCQNFLQQMWKESLKYLILMGNVVGELWEASVRVIG